MDTLRKIIGYALILLFFAGSVCGVVYGVKYAVTANKVNNMYTKDELEESYNDGYSDGIAQYDNLSYYITLSQELQARIDELNDELSSLQSQSATDSATIKELEYKISVLNSDLSYYLTRIAELEDAVDTYEGYFSELQGTDYSVVSFKVGDSTYGVQLVSMGETAVVEDWSTDYVVINYWTVDGVTVNPETYVINQNTIFVADVTYYYSVKFCVGYDCSEPYDEQIIQLNSYAEEPSTSPTKTDCDFYGWTLDGETTVDVSTYEITEDTTFLALFVSYNWKTYGTNSMLEGDYLFEFNGKYFYYNITASYVLYLVDISTLTYTVVPESSYSEYFSGLDDLVLFSVLDSSYFWSYNGNYFYSAGGHYNYYYIYDSSTNTWVNDTVTNSKAIGLSGGSTVIIEGKCYALFDSVVYVLDSETLQWSIDASWTNFVNGHRVVELYENYYYFYGTDVYILNLDTLTWEETETTIFSFEELGEVYNIFTYDSNYYYASSGCVYILTRTFSV